MEDKKQKSGLVVGILVVVLIAAAFVIGRLSSQVELLTKGTSKVFGVPSVPTAAPAVGQTQNDPAAGLAVDKLKQYAKDMGLKSDQFNKCLDDSKFAQKVKDDAAYGAKVGVSGTPTFFINDAEVVGAYPQNIFEDIINFELAGGNWNKPTDKVKYLLDKSDQNGEVTLGQKVETGKGWVQGNANAKIRMVEFSDFQCPYCGKSYPIVKALQKEFGDKLVLEYRHFPLTFHPYAQKAAEASECAGEQGKFWEMHDKMFGLQQAG